MSICRRFEVLQGKEWVPIEIENIKNHQIIRIFEDDGTRHIGADGRNIMMAQSDSYVNENGKWCFKC